MAAYDAVLIGENFAEAGTLSGGSYSGSFPITNLQNRDQRIVARTTNALNASTIITSDLGSAQQIGGVIVCNGNWSLDSRYIVESCDAADFISIKYSSGWKQYPGFVVDPSLLDADNPDVIDGVLRDTLLPEYPLNLIEIIPVSAGATARARFWRIRFDDTANVNGYLQYGYLMIGRAWRPTINFNGNNGFTPVIPYSNPSESLGLKRTWFERGFRRSWQAAFSFLTTNELYGNLTRLVVKSRDSRPVFIVIDPSNTVYLQVISFLATFKVLPKIMQLTVPSAGSTAVELEELK